MTLTSNTEIATQRNLSYQKPANPPYKSLQDEGIYFAKLVHEEPHPFDHHIVKLDIETVVAYIRGMATTEDRASLLNVLPSLLSYHFKHRDNTSHLAKQIRVFRAARQLYPKTHRFYVELTSDLATSLCMRVRAARDAEDIADLDEGIELYDHILPLIDYDDPFLSHLLLNLGKAYTLRFRRHQELADLEAAISHLEHCLQITHSSRRASVLHELALTLYARFEQLEDIADLNRVIDLHRQSLCLLPSTHPTSLDGHISLFRSLHRRYKLLSEVEDIEQSIQHQQFSITLIDAKNPKRRSLLLEIGGLQWQYYKETKVMAHLNTAIHLESEALTLPHSQDDTSGLANDYVDLINMLFFRFELTRDTRDMDECLRLQEEALSHLPTDIPRPAEMIAMFGEICMLYGSLQGTVLHTDLAIRHLTEAYDLYAQELESTGKKNRHPSLMLDLSLVHTRRYERFARADDLESALSLGPEILSECPPGSPLHPNYLVNRAALMMVRYSLGQEIHDVHDSIDYLQTAIDLLVPGTDPTLRLAAISNLGSALEARFWRLRDINDIQESIKLSEEAVELARLHKPAKLPEVIHILASAFKLRFETTGDVAGIDDAIKWFQQGVAMFPLGHAASIASLCVLVNALHQRYNLFGDASDIMEAFHHLRQTFQVITPDHKDYALVLSQFLSMSKWTDWDGSEDDFNNQLKTLSHALELCPAPHPHRIHVLGNIAAIYRKRSRLIGSSEDLDRSIGVYGLVLNSLDPKDTNYSFTISSLAHTLRLRFSKNWGGISDLDDALELYKLAASHMPRDHPQVGPLVEDTGDVLMDRVTTCGRLDDLDEAMTHYERAANHTTSGSSSCFSAAHKWASKARQHRHNSTLQAYSTALSMLDRFVTISHTIEAQHKRLALIPRALASNAASFAISEGRLALAVEFLEQGRTLLWSQVGRYRTPLDRLKQINPSIAVEFRRLSIQLEKNVVASSNEKVRDAADYRSLSRQWEAVIEQIRATEGFSDFLKSTPFSKLQQAAELGPVIVINIDEFRSDALIVQRNDPPVHVPLTQANPHVIGSLAADLAAALRLNGYAADKTVSTKITAVLRGLWDVVIHPIVKVLEGDCGIPNGSRIWWCPTSALWSLPLHAAGPYKRGERNLPDIYISSYTPTLSALLRSLNKQPKGTDQISQTMLVVSQAQTPGEAPLQSVAAELEQVQLVAPSIRLLDGEKAVRDTVAQDLQYCSWAHFACHGHQDLEHPLNSRFMLHDRPLTLLDIIQSNLPKAEFAFLSACHSAAGDWKNPNEAIHLAAGLQFSGFGGVVGTMWAMADVDGPIMAKEFYQYMFRGGRAVADYRDAAGALNHATKVLRRMKVPVERWINFIHLGA